MTTASTLLERNERSLANHQPRPMNVALNTMVVSCLDPRSDPAHVLGLEPGDALVLRNAGGRVTPDVEVHIAMLATMAKSMGMPLFELVIVHHSDCGMERLADDVVRSKVTAAAGLASGALDVFPIHDHDHERSLREDFDCLSKSSIVPSGLLVTAMVLDHESGSVEVAFSEVTP